MTETLKFNEINKIPALTWNWLKMNRDSFELRGSPSVFEPKILDLPEGFSVISCEKIDLDKFPVLKSGIGEELSAYLEENVFKGVDQIIEISGKVAPPLLLSFDYAKAGGTDSGCRQLASSQIIYAKKDSESCVIFLYEGEDSSKIDSIIRTKIYAEENASLHIVKVQLLGKDQNQIDETSTVAGENSKIHFTQIELGGNHIDSGLYTELREYKARFKSELAFIARGSQHFDFNHAVIHTGSETDTKMLVKGVLDENAVKNYRGTIDFKRGCYNATGDEQEETLLMSKSAVNKSIPMILCDEENVSGTHGATLGRLGADELFYMKSRGIGEEEAKKMMTKAKVLSVAKLIPNEGLCEKIESWLEK
ncbi:MAG: SufD family Fe-S cluster assembly protein [Treponema sp.]|nr:SufD family Fe-S cluster assembly protein [Treponema sp.]